MIDKENLGLGFEQESGQQELEFTVPLTKIVYCTFSNKFYNTCIGLKGKVQGVCEKQHTWNLPINH